ncbi:unnamed protein product [Mytilus edulis]|uniref:Uncharacterized protein n=1 Tax=Mytilus edulis TaxID=6550 RepID=A0A8S3QB74_MYTED|nr:unnamed protein product [Mytilus edulis]
MIVTENQQTTYEEKDRSFSGKLTGILLSKLESGNEKMKIGMLTVFKHLINAATESMQDKQEVVVSGLKMMLSEQNNKLKKVFAQVVIAMAHHGYLELEGGQQMIEFIIKQSALKNDPPGKKSPDPEYVSNQALRTMCDHVLQLLTTTVEDMEHVLWPYLLELIVPEQYTEAQGVVCKCLSHLATKKRKEQTEDYEIDFETQANIPKPEALIARLMVLAGRPQNGRNRGIHVLTLMQGLVPNLNENLVELWDTVIPKLIQYLEDASKKNHWTENWEDLSHKQRRNKRGNIARVDQYPSHSTNHGIKRKKKADELNKAELWDPHSDLPPDLLHCRYLDITFLHAQLLHRFTEGIKHTCNNLLFDLNTGEKSEVDIERTKATLMLCYGFVALFSLQYLIVSRMEATILRSIQPYFANVKQPVNGFLSIEEKLLLENMEPSSNNITDFPTECVILAKLVPRCTDPNIRVRQMAMDCVQCTLRIASKIAGNSMDQPDQMIDALCTLKERLEKDDPNVLFSVINDLAKVIAKKLPSGQLIEFLDVLQEGLLDPQSHSSSGACVVLNGILKARGNEVSKQVSTIIGYLHDKLGQIEFDQTRTGTLRSVRTLSSHHLTNVLKALLSYPLPYDSNIVAIWQILSQDAMLTSGFTDQMLDMLSRQLPYEEKKDGERTTKIATQTPLAVTCALKIIFDVEESEEVVKKNYHRFFSSLLIRIGSSIDCKPPKPVVEEKESKPKEKKKSVPPPSSKVPVPSLAAVEAFRSFLQRSKSEDIIEGLDKEDCWEMFEDEERYPESVTILCRYLVESAVGGPYISKIVTSLASGLSSLYDPQRVTVAAFFSELINLKCAGNDDMIEMVMNSLLGRLVDSSHMVRMLCIRGLGNVASNEKQQVQQYSTTVLSAMMAGMDDKEDPEDLITTESMSGLSKILSEIDESHIRAILINVSLRIRPCFEKDRPAVRAQAFILFGNLSRFGDGPSKAPFLEQIHSNFVSLLLHLNDPEQEACKFSLRLLGPLLESEAINNKFQKYLLEDANLIYGEFMNDLAKCIIQDFPDKVNFYVMGCISFYKSMWSEIKCNAALFTALIILLKDQSPSVRAAAAEAMSLLYEY